jgi:hypothetical protein
MLAWSLPLLGGQVPQQVWVAKMLQSDWLKKYQFSDGIFHQIQN